MLEFLFIGLVGSLPLILLDASLAGPAAANGFTPWIAIVWAAVWCFPPAAKLALILAKFGWGAVKEAFQ